MGATFQVAKSSGDCRQALALCDAVAASQVLADAFMELIFPTYKKTYSVARVSIVIEIGRSKLYI